MTTSFVACACDAMVMMEMMMMMMMIAVVVVVHVCDEAPLSFHGGMFCAWWFAFVSQ